MEASKQNCQAIWERVSKDIVYSKNGYLLFDDFVLDKRSSRKIEVARWQYSGTERKCTPNVRPKTSQKERLFLTIIVSHFNLLNKL